MTVLLFASKARSSCELQRSSISAARLIFISESIKIINSSFLGWKAIETEVCHITCLLHQRFVLRKRSLRPLNFPLLVDDLRKQHFNFSFSSDNVRMTQFSFKGVLIVVLNSQEIFNFWFHSERKSTNIGIPKWPIAMQKLHARAVTRAWILYDKGQSDEHYWEENFEEQL